MAAPAANDDGRVSSLDLAEARWSDAGDVDARWYEHRKREIVLATLPSRRYARALEIGCSGGALTEQLADRCDDLLAVDPSPDAVDRARGRLAGRVGVTVELRDVCIDMPSGTFDLVVFAEIGCALSFAQLDVALAAIEAAIGDRGSLLACHWRRPVAENTLSGDDVHSVLEARGLPRIARHEEADFVIDVYSRDACSVAQHEGIT